jgi:putative membrane protein insertion efficiency factor
MFKEIVKIVKTSILVLIKSYQMTRVFRPSCCRFYPSCSDYSVQAIKKHGVFKGLILTVGRLIKCHPWYQEGVDSIELS